FHGTRWCWLIGSATCLPIVRAGFSEDIGSWKIMAIRLPRIERMPASSRRSRSLPSNRISPLAISPGGLGIRRRIDRAVTLLPDPDSPTIARVSPPARSNETLSIAVTTPRSVRKRVVRSRTCRSGVAMRSEPHLLLELLVDPDAGVDRARPHRPGAQLTAVVLHPRPPCRVLVGRRQPDVRRCLDDVAGELLDDLLALGLVALLVGLLDARVELRVRPHRRVPGLLRDEALADRRGRVGMAVVHEVP